VSALQLSLVVFLIFKQSALALVLSEIAIVIILILLGIGEFWMFDLVLILGLLFLITSLSQRSGRSSSMAPHTHPLLEESEGEEDSHSDHHQHELASRSAALVKIIIFFVQTTAAIVNAAAWPHWVVNSVKQLNALNLRVSGIECFAPSVLAKAEAKILVQLSMPWILGLNILIAAAIAALWVYLDPIATVKAALKKCSRKPKRPSSSDDARSSDAEHLDRSDSKEKFIVAEEEPLLASADMEEADDERDASLSYDQILKRVQFSVLFLLSASYFELSNVVFETLRPCSHGHMVAFPYISCSWSESQFVSLVAISIAFLLLYTVGIPAFFGIIMRVNRRRILAGDPNIESRVGFLYESYKCVNFNTSNIVPISSCLLLGPNFFGGNWCGSCVGFSCRSL
jgi:hypothetical protein